MLEDLVIAPRRKGFLHGADSPELVQFIRKHNHIRIAVEFLDLQRRSARERRQAIREMHAEIERLRVTKYIRHRQQKIAMNEANIRRAQQSEAESRRWAEQYTALIADYLRANPGPLIHAGRVYDLVDDRVRICRVEDRPLVTALDDRRAAN